MKGIGTYTLRKGGKVVREKVAKVETFTAPMDYKNAQTRLRKQLKKWKRMWGQESIGFELEEEMFLI